VRELTTPRLLLRPFGWSDFEALHRLVYADPAVAPWWTGRTRTLDEVRESFARKVAQRAGEPGWLAVTRAEEARLLGLIGLLPVGAEDAAHLVFERPEDALRPDRLEAELAYALGRAHWGRGYATEAGRAVLDYGFAELGLDRVVSSINSANDRSVALARRLGCRVVPNLHPRPHWSCETPGVIALLDRVEWLERSRPGQARPA
jgi:RimJ/RimL family protein N-acetyltransferase